MARVEGVVIGSVEMPADESQIPHQRIAASVFVSSGADAQIGVAG